MRRVNPAGRDTESELDYIGRTEALSMARHGSPAGAVVTSGTSSIVAGLGPSSLIGNSDFTMRVVFRVPALGTFSSTPHVFILTPLDYAATGESFICYLWPDTRLGLRLYGLNSTSNYRSKRSRNSLATFAGKVVEVVVVRQGAEIRLYVNGEQADLLEDPTGGTPPADWSATIKAGHLIMGTQGFKTEYYAATLYNYALSRQQIELLGAAGTVEDGDQWGNPRQLITEMRDRDFNPSSLNWQQGTMNSWNNAGDLSLSAAGGGEYVELQIGAFGGGWVANKRYKLDFTAANPVFNTFTATVRNQPYWVFAAPIVSGKNIGVMYPGANSIESLIIVANGVGSIDLDDFSLYREGAILDLDMEVGIGYQIPDRSSNRFHGYASAGCSHLVGKRSGQVRGRTNTSGNQLLLGRPSLPQNARINSIVVNAESSSSGANYVGFGSSSGGNQIADNKTLLTGAGRNEIPLKAEASPNTPSGGFTNTTNIWVKSDVSANFDTTITYELVD